MKFEFSTDTATIAFFDPMLLQHKLNEPADWWTRPSVLLKEMNANNLIVAGLGQDGFYRIEIVLMNETLSVYSFQAYLNCVSGRIYVGPGEDISGGELEPDESLGGRFIEVPSGLYIIRAQREDKQIIISLSQLNNSNFKNDFTDELVL
ncbi:MAG: DUF6386 family protein [Leptospiraceae bacterium]|nr:DUF6386 family protein [Leptospiraceae bacterium]